MQKSENRIMRKYILFFLVIGSLHASSLNILHLSFHKGCIREINTIAQQLHLNVTSVFVPDIAPYQFDGYSTGNALYNIGRERAYHIWHKHKDYFNQFDAIITSDTAPLARIFLQNDYQKPLIIWICNRFDYTDYGSLDCDFPDAHYYDLFNQAHDKKNVFTIPYTAFESLYAQQHNVVFNHDVVRPTGIIAHEPIISQIPAYINKSKTFFIPPYLNDSSLNVTQACLQQQISTYQGRYNGPDDLQEFKGIIHIPYAWSNVAFFENIQHGLPYFVPSLSFMLEHLEKGKIWWMNSHYFEHNYHLSEWYCDEHRDIITYFDSWDDLKNKIESTDFDALRTKIKTYAQQLHNKTIEQWRNIFALITKNG